MALDGTELAATNNNSNHIHTSDNTKRRLTKNEKRRAREKSKASSEPDPTAVKENIPLAAQSNDNIIIEYVSPKINLDIPTLNGSFDETSKSSVIEEFKSIFQKFTSPEELLSATTSESTTNTSSNASISLDSKKENEATAKQQQENKISKKKFKLASRLSVAELKQLVARPDVVEAHDVTSSDPRLLVTLKATRNTVQVPRHWCSKRKYLQGKRGIEKPPFQLPEFIADTGIAKIRESLLEQENLKKSKQKARDRIQPKMGRIDIDYQVLHDAFFKFQTKPKMTIHGDLYYEGKEFEVHVKDSKPGFLSANLREALGMTENSPPPYLINMQRYGPPPSYPTLKIPGLNCPIPLGASFGYQTGGWGKPPVDEYGRPIYGDVFGQAKQSDDVYTDINVDKKTKWGELTITEKEEEEEEEESEDEEEETETVRKGKRPLESSGLETPYADGITTTTTGLETPSVIDLRKRSGLDTPNSMYGSYDSGPKDLYKVLPQKQVTTQNGQVFSSDRAYVISEDTSYDDKNKEDESNHENDGQNGKKKRRLDSSTSVQKLKDFKF